MPRATKKRTPKKATVKRKPKRKPRKKRVYVRSRPHNAKISDESIDLLKAMSGTATQKQMADALSVSLRHVRRLLRMYDLESRESARFSSN